MAGNPSTGTLTLSLILAVLTSHPAAQAPTVRAESARYSVEALDAGAADRPARIIVSDNTTSRKHMVMVNGTLGELTRAVIRADEQRVTLVCRKGFAVLDPAGVANTDEVYGLDAVVAPGGRWIAYRRFVPATHPGPSDGILVYDTGLSREKNHGAYPVVAEREWRAGRAIYPPTDEWKDANTVSGEGEAYTLTSPVTWEGGQRAPVLLFSMRHAGEDAIVLAEMNEDSPRTCWSMLPGGAARWRVKTLTYARSPSAHTVSVVSGAQPNPAETTLSFPFGCSGQQSPSQP